MWPEFVVQALLVGAVAQSPAECRTATPEQIAAMQAAPATAAAAAQRERLTAHEDRLFAEFVIPEGPWRSPPDDARVVFRTVAPPGGLYGNTIRTAVWQERDGSWWFWKQDRDPRLVQIPPPPPAPGAPPAPQRSLAPAETDRWPPVGGRLDPQQAQTIEASLADPCREAAGPFWPGEVPPPPRPAIPGAPPPPPPPPPVPDSTAVYVRMTEAGRDMRRLGAWRTGHGNALIAAVAWPRPAAE